jgi:hypothetical protein
VLEVAFDVDGEGFEGADVDDAAPHRLAGSGPLDRCVAEGVEQQAVETPEERGKGFAGSGRREDQRAFAAGDGGPAEALWGGGRAKGGAKPVARDGMEEGEGVGSRAAAGGWPGKVSSHSEERFFRGHLWLRIIPANRGYQSAERVVAQAG